MPSLEAYSRSLPYSYAPGIFPSIECVKRRPRSARRLLVHSGMERDGGALELLSLCAAAGIRVETADRALRLISRKENCYAAIVFDKFAAPIDSGYSHVVLVNPSDQGNLGTILRTLAGFGLYDLAIIEPAADVYDPHVVRASMGALFVMRVSLFPDWASYKDAYADHARYPFMLDARYSLPEISMHPDLIKTPYALIFGNEGAGLPSIFTREGVTVRIPQTGDVDSLNLAIAVALGAYAFRGAAGNMNESIQG